MLDEKILDKIEEISEQECTGLHRIPYNLLVGHCGVVFAKAGVPKVNPIPEEYFDAVIFGICDYFYDGCEPEFETEEEYERFEAAIEKLKTCQYVTEEKVVDQYGYTYYKNGHKSPYQDKTIPFLAYPKRN